MPVNLMMGGHDPWREPQTLQLHKIRRPDIRPDQIVKNLVIAGKSPQNPPPVHPARTNLIIIVFCPAAITAELLVCPAITDSIPTLQAHGGLS